MARWSTASDNWYLDVVRLILIYIKQILIITAIYCIILIRSEPFIKKDKHGNSVAVLLMDTQGMFDSDTSMSLTAQIFGLSTFVSSYQVRTPT